MLKKIVLYFFSLLFLFFSCEDKPILSFNDYESNVNCAESFILDKKFNDALLYYKKAHNIKDYSLGLDCYNAMICAVHLGDFEEFKYWAYKLASKGININFFKPEIFRKFKKSEDWSSFTEGLNIKNKGFLVNYNDKLNKSIKYLVDQDQEQYCKLKYDSDSSLISKTHSTTFKIDLEIKRLIEKYGDFSEEKIGLNIVDDTTLLRTPIFWALARHNFQVEGELFFNDFLESMLDKGLIKKDIIDYIEHTPLSSNIVLINGKYYINNGIPKDKDFTEKNIKRIKFLKKNDHLKFLIFPQFYEIHFKTDGNNNHSEKDSLYGFTLIEGL